MRANVERQLNSYIHVLSATEKKSLLGYVKTTFPGKEEEAMSLEQENKELEDIDAAMDRGRILHS